MTNESATVTKPPEKSDLPNASEDGSNKLRSSLRRWLPLAALGLIMIVGFSQGWHENLTLSALIRERQDLIAFVDSHLLLSILGFVAAYAAAVALSFPGASLLTIAGGFLFGWALGGAMTVFAATLGAVAVFLVAKTSLGETLTERAGPFLSKISKGFREDGFNYLLFLRLTPVFPFWLVNIAPAIFKMPLPAFALGTFIGIIPGTFAFAFIGSGLDSVIAAQEQANPGCAAQGTCSVEVGALVTPQLLAALFALGVASLIPIGLKRFRKTK
nr:TVP38/TMEM64 family protein [Roseibium hamelinense]